MFAGVLVSVAAVAAVVGFLKLVRSHLAKHRERTTLKDIQGNIYATGSDVTRLYPDAVKNGVFVVTGTTSGLGEETALQLGKNGGMVIMGVRKIDEGQRLLEIIRHHGGDGHVLKLDLSSLDSVKEFASEVEKVLKGRKIDALINNAGIAWYEGKTIDGFQTVWQVNAMAPALLTDLLEPVMSDQARIVNVSSASHNWLKLSRTGDLTALCPPDHMGGKDSYANDYALSKACQILHAHELNLRYRGTEKRAFATRPGMVVTQITRHFKSEFRKAVVSKLFQYFGRSVEQGCCTTLFCALANLEDLGNEFPRSYYENCLPQKAMTICENDEEAMALRKVFGQCWKKGQ